ncbi:hypothetical protein VTL71DRAFT_14739 [Oculimacula yallundae]|uniref:Uncharacterized protein n=1 Tax=Oculimacula yallundae TaxID=86028 RepID=A0ABR4CJC0_9HELO
MSSTGATYGSDCNRSIGPNTTPSKSDTTSQKRKKNLSWPANTTSTSQKEKDHIDLVAIYLIDTVHELPHFDKGLLEDDVHVRTAQMKEYLDKFDETMEIQCDIAITTKILSMPDTVLDPQCKRLPSHVPFRDSFHCTKRREVHQVKLGRYAGKLHLFDNQVRERRQCKLEASGDELWGTKTMLIKLMGLGN